MQIVKVKICGLTNLEDAWRAAELGADLLGFNFYAKSPRYVSVEKAAEIAEKLPAFVQLAGIFVNAEPSFIREAIQGCHLEWVQLHGDEEPGFCESLRSDSVKVIKALRVRQPDDLQAVERYNTDAVLVDAYHPELYGGSGVQFDWTWLDRPSPRRIFLAGGIHPDNAAKAAQLGVYGIDICSGVEAAPGRKDHEKLKALFENIRHLRG